MVKLQRTLVVFVVTFSLFRLEIPVGNDLSSVPPQSFDFSPSGVENMSYHELTSGNSDDVVFLSVIPQQTEMMHSISLRIYFLLTEK